MNKYEILALMMRKESQFDCDPFSLAVLLAARLEIVEGRLSDEDFSYLIRLGGCMYQLGLERHGEAAGMEDPFPVAESWPWGATNGRSGFRHG